MKNTFRWVTGFIAIITVSLASAQTTFTLNGLTSFGTRFDGSIQPGDSIGTSPMTGNDIPISAGFPGIGTQPGDPDVRPGGSTNGFNMRGMSWDPVSGNLVFVDTHLGSGGTIGGNGAISPLAAVYILDSNSGQIVGALKTNGIFGGSYTHVVAGVADDGVVYVCNQTLTSTSPGFKIYRWSTANVNDPLFNASPVVAFSNTFTPSARIGQTMDVRGSGPNTQIIAGSGSSGANKTNVYLFTTTNGTNFSSHVLSFPGITTDVFNDGIAFGPGNTFWAKEVGKPFLYLAFDPVTFAGSVISSFTASSVNDPLLNISAIAVDPVHHLLGGLEEIGGTATGGRGKVWLFDMPDPTNKAPAVLASRIYIPNYQKTIAPMGYMRFTSSGRLYAHASNNGFLASTVDTAILSPPTFTTDLPGATRVVIGKTIHFEVFAVADVTNYQWYSNNVAITGANTYYLDVPNIQTTDDGVVYKVVVSNAAGSATSADSTVTVTSDANFFHPNVLWTMPANTIALSDPTNFITSNGGAGTPNERTIAYNALSNQLLVVRGPTAAGNLKIFVIDADRGTNGALYVLKTNGIASTATLNLCGIGVADDGAVYAASVSSAGANDQSFKVYRWADSGSNTIPQLIFGTNSTAAKGSPIDDQTGTQTYRFGDTLAVRGSGMDTEIIVDSQNSAKFAGILRPLDGTMLNWEQKGYLLQNTAGSYGSEAYGTTIGRSLQFGNGLTFWQKRYNGAAGAPLAEMSYNAGGGLAPLVVANSSAGLFTNGPIAINFPLKLAAGVNFVGGVGTDSTALQGLVDTLSYYDFTDPSQAVLLNTYPLPQGSAGVHKGNTFGIAQVIFGVNPVTGTNLIFVLDGNNGVVAYTLSGGVTPPPTIIVQPRNLRLLEGGSGLMTVTVDQPTTIQWYRGTTLPAYTGVSGSSYSIANAQTSDADDYFLIATNINGSVTSHVAHVSIGLAKDAYSLFQNWAANPASASFPYVSSDGGGNTPNERAFAYNALSNQLIVVRCPPGLTTYTVSVVNATSGTFLYSLNTSGVIHEGLSEVPGANPIDLVGAAAADDGSIYICSESPNASGGQFGDASKMFHVFRWTNSAPGTPPVLVFEGDPASQPAGLNFRWGDVMTARGSGANTELALNSIDGSYGAILKPTDNTLNTFTNLWFVDSGGGGSIGRSIQFGTNNTIFEKRKSSSLIYSKYDTNAHSSFVLFSVDSSSTLGGVAVDTTHHLAVGVDFVGSTLSPKPDAVALYDITDPLTPMLIKQYNFPANQVANGNVICQTIIAGDRVWALDGNNGMLAFTITSPTIPQLTITRDGPNVVLSWPLFTGGYVLQSSPSLSPPITWTAVSPAPTIVGGLNVVTNPASGAGLFYRLKH